MTSLSFWCEIFTCALALVAGALYAWLKSRYRYWKLRGVEGPEPSLLTGNIAGVLSSKISLADAYTSIYERYKSSHRYVGTFMLFRPTLLVTDLELVKRVLVKDFDHFTDHMVAFDDRHEPLAGHLFNLCGDEWRKLRGKLSPTFTTSRLKEMYVELLSSARAMSEHIGEGGVFDAKDITARYAIDFVGSTALGLKCNSFKDPDSAFRKIGKLVTNPPIITAILHFLIFFLPGVMRFYKFSILRKEINDFFRDTVREAIEYREKNGVRRKDFLQLLIELKNRGSLEDDHSDKIEVDDGMRLTMKQLTAQVFVFFIGGIESSSSVAGYALYELATNPDKQEKLYEETKQVLKKHNNEFTYDSLHEMPYLMKVLEETMRKHPPLSIVYRVCTKEYVIPDTNIVIEKDTPVIIPVYGIHRDPDIYTNPDEFEPDRFSPENRETRPRYAFMPFGEGPRNCIAGRLGLIQTKMAVATLVSKYKVCMCEKTQISCKYEKKSFVTTSECGVWLDFKKRIK